MCSLTLATVPEAQPGGNRMNDRIAALVGNLRGIGGEAHELEDGIRIVPAPLRGGEWKAHHDHRMAVSGRQATIRRGRTRTARPSGRRDKDRCG